MYIVRERDLSPDDLAFLAAKSNLFTQTEEIARRSLVIRDNTSEISPFPACISSLVQWVPVSTVEA